MALLECQTPKGWGTLWGSPWGGPSTPATPGGPLPFISPFDIYCVCGPSMVFIQTYIGVSTTPGSHFTVDIPTQDLIIESNDSVDAFLFIDSFVPSDYTIEAVIKFENLPPTLSDLPNKALFLGVVNITGACVGLFFSQTDLGYAGAVNGAMQVLPNSQGIINQAEYFVIRIAVNSTLGAAYVYITSVTEAINIGQHLRFILPLIPYTSLPPGTQEGTHMHVLGTAGDPSKAWLDSICLATGALIPNLPPIANAGTDQAARLCQIVQLDGSASFDPEGQPLSYQWRLIDAPVKSMFVFGGLDGKTYPLLVPTGFTNKFYSTAFGGLDPIPIVVGTDVLVVAGKPYTIMAQGADINGDYVQIDGFFLPDNLVNAAFKVIKQNGLNGSTNVKMTFLPDVPGFYKFDLTVFDGSLYSTASVSVVNVLESFLPRGCTPDLRFLWDYLSDFWDLVEDRERIETIWSGAAQQAATELYTLWQVEYSKSLRDIQRTFIRRWLHYDLFLREPFPEITKTRSVWRGVETVPLSNAGAVYAGQKLTLSIPFADDLVTVTVTTPGVLSPQKLAGELKKLLQAVDKRFNVTAVFFDPLNTSLNIYAPFPFTIIGPGTTLPFLPYAAGPTNEPLVQQVSGLLTAPTVYKAPFSLLGLDIQENDIFYTLSATGETLVSRVVSIADNPTDAFRFQRIILKDPLPLSVTSDWGIGMRSTSTQLNFWDGLCTSSDMALYEVVDGTTGSVAFFTSKVLGATKGNGNDIGIATDAILVDYFAQPTRFTVSFWGVYRRGYMPIESVIVDIPLLQRVIKDPPESSVLRRNVDFYIEDFRDKHCIRFDQGIFQVELFEPLPRLWAEYTYLDNRPDIEANFGLPVEFTLDDLSKLGTGTDYLSAVRGLWYAYLNGPTLYNLRVGTQILLGLPFAEEDGVIEEIRTDFSPVSGRVLVRDSANPEVVRSYTFPKKLVLEVNPATGVAYKEGDKVTQFAPLVTGAEVIDWVKDPTYFQGFINQGFFYEIEKFHRFLIRVDSAAFNLAALLFVKSFILKVKPTYTYPLFIVRAQVPDTEIDVDDVIVSLGTLSLYDGAIMKQPFTVPPPFGGPLDLVSTYESATMFDQPDPSPGWKPVASNLPPAAPAGLLSGHWVNAFDTSSIDNTNNTYPVLPNADLGITWGFDRGNIAPEMFIVGVGRDTTNYSGGPALPKFDDVFVFDRPVWKDIDPFVFGQTFLLHVPPGAQRGALLMEYMDSAPYGMTVNTMQLWLKGRSKPTDSNFILEVWVNGVLQFSDGFTHTFNSQNICWTDVGPPYTGPPFFLCQPMLAFAIAPGDEVQARIRPAGPGHSRPYFTGIMLVMGEAIPWAFGVPVPASPQYSLVKML